MLRQLTVVGLLFITGLALAIISLLPPEWAKPVWAHPRLAPQLQGGFTPVQNVTQVSAKRLHNCLLTQSGGVKCWGLNDNGRLGDNSTTQRNSAVNVVGLNSGVNAVYVGGHHSCALLTSGEVKCWGRNAEGELGSIVESDLWTPALVVGLAGAVDSLALGGSHTCALLTSGAVQCWGNNIEGQLGRNSMQKFHRDPATVSGLGSGVKAIVANSVHSCALLTNGSVQCWGGNVFGQIGDGSTNHRATPVPVNGLSSGVSQLRAGRDHNCVLLTNGTVKCWGLNTNGQLGNDDTQNQSTPVDVSGLSGTVVELTGGGDHTCARLSGGTAYCWGDNFYGQVGDGTTTDRGTPVKVSDLNNVVAITAGQRHTCARLSDNQVKCWGRNDNGQVGDGSVTTPRKTPVYVVETTTGLPSLTLSSVTINESAGAALISINLSAASANVVTVNYATSNGTAIAGNDYTTSSGILTFAAGETSKTINVALLNDALDEADETVNLTLSTPSNATLGSPATATLTLADDDPTPTVQFNVTSSLIGESDGIATIQVNLSAASGRSVSVYYVTSNGMATAGSDYTTRSGTLTFNPSVTSQSFTIPIANDNLDEADETVNLGLNTPSNATLGTPAAATLTITDNDSAPTVQFSTPIYTVNENAGAALITANLAQTSGRSVTVAYATSNGSASAGSDYSASSGTLTFNPGVTSQNFAITLLNDGTAEPNETVNLALNNPANATLGNQANATVAIIDDDSGAVAPTANFAVNPRNGFAPLTVQFIDQSTGSINNWSWSFGDNGTSTVQNPSHTYGAAGDYTVALTVSGPSGTNTQTRLLYIHVDPGPSVPVASFTANQTRGNAPLIVNFTDQSTGTPTAWLWNFGDGNTSTQQHPTHTYSGSGDYTVSLAVTAPGGQNTVTLANYIHVTPTTASLVPNFTANPVTGEKPLVVNFTDLSTGPLTGWLWNFGDNSTSTAQHPQHTYANTGEYTVSLVVHGADGEVILTKSNYIRVREVVAPTADFTSTLGTGSAPLAVGFLDQSQGTITSWSWSFGDGNTSALQNPTYTYTTPGDYTVSLTVAGSLGLHTKTRPAYIRISAPRIPLPPVMNPVQAAESAGGFTLVWSESDDAATYELQEQFNNGAWITLYSGAATNYSVNARSSGLWCYRVRAANSVGTSDWSAPQCLNIAPSARSIYLPLASYQPVATTTPIPPTPTWQRVGQAQLEVAALAIQGNLLFAGERRAPPIGGLYRRTLDTCAATPVWARIGSVTSNVLTLGFQQAQGIVGGDNNVFYSNNDGNSWTASVVQPDLRTSAVTLANGALYAGAEIGGIFRSDDGGQSWHELTATVANINALAFHGTTLWIGTDQSGVWAQSADSDDPQQQSSDLASTAQQQVWDFIFAANNRILIATYDGVYQRAGNGTWQAFGLTGQRVRSLALVDQQLYAGGIGMGVWQRPLDGSQEWQAATAPGWDNTYSVRDLLHAPACAGLLAATNDGVWIYR